MEPADLKGLKIRTAADPITIDIFQALGAATEQIAFSELYVALQQGVVDGQENPLANIASARLYEVTPQISLSAHRWESTPFLASQIGWARLTPEQQATVQEAAIEAGQLQRQLMQESDEQLLAEFQENPEVEVHEVDREAFEEATAPVIEAWQQKLRRFRDAGGRGGRQLMARAVPESPAAGRVLALAGGVDRVIAAVCQVIILVTTIVLLGVLGANVVARYAFGGGGLHWVSEVPEQLFPWRRFAHAVIAAGVATGVVMLVIMASAVVGWIMTFVQAPQLFATWAIETLQTPWLIILAMIGIMLVAGMFIDLPAAILLLGPISPPAHYGLPPGFSIDELCARHPGLGAGIRAEVRADSEHRRDRTRCRWSR